jgi:hypothetical protein
LFDAVDGTGGIDATTSSLVESVDPVNFRVDSTAAEKRPIETKRSAANPTHNVATQKTKTSKSFGLEELCADKSEND